MNKLNKIFPVIELSPWIHEDKIEIINGENYNQFKEKIKEKYGHPLGVSLRISELSGNDLKGIIKIELFDYYEKDLNLDEIFPFDGGIVMQIDENNFFSHSVGSGMISNYKNWFHFLESQPSDWAEIWIGRPWIYGRIRNGIIQLTNYHDETVSMPQNDDSKILYQFELNSFIEELNKARLSIDDFRNKIGEILKEENNLLWLEISKSLIEK